MKNMQTEESKKKLSKQNKGFYVALAICVVAIGAAAWTTYGSVVEYSENQNQQISELMQDESSQDIKTGNEVSDVPYENSKENSEQTSEQSSKISKTEESTEISESSAEPTMKHEKKIVEPIKDTKIIKQYSPENPLESKTMGDWRTHNGVDIAAADGTLVLAMADGIVTEINNDTLYGTVVRIEHENGYTALYGGLSPTVTVQVGNDVEAGDTIGAVYVVPCERLEESHIHLVMYKDGKLMNPIDFWS